MQKLFIETIDLLKQIFSLTCLNFLQHSPARLKFIYVIVAYCIE